MNAFSFSDEVFEDMELDHFNDPDLSDFGLGYFSDGFQVTDLEITDLEELDDLDPEEALAPEDDLQDLVVVQSDPVDYSDQLALLREDLSSLNARMETCNYLLSALLFLLLFWFCYNRIKNAVRMFTGRKIKND